MVIRRSAASDSGGKGFPSAIARLLTITLISAWGAPLHAAPPRCADLMPSAEEAGDQRLIEARDLAALRDIGKPDASVFDPSPLGLSPDGKHIAFVMRKADAQANVYCQGLFVIAARPGTHPVQIDGGGEMIHSIIGNLRGLVTPTGNHVVNTPIWSPDGSWIAYRKRMGGVTQAWLVRPDGSDARPVPPAPGATGDVEALAWSPDGRELLLATRSTAEAQRERIEAEGRSGYRYDDRFVPTAGALPFTRAPLESSYWLADPASGMVRAAGSEDVRRIAPDRLQRRTVLDSHEAIAADGRRAWTRERDPNVILGPVDLWAELPGAASIRCSDATCADGVVGLWWSPDGHSLSYLRQEGWAKGSLALYRWTPGQSPRRTFATDDYLTGCRPTGEALICLFEGATRPRHVVRITAETGRVEPLFDPNPEFALFTLGSAQRLRWRSDGRTENFGELVLPPDHRAGQRHPLIIVQYQARGFLRGGTGDEYPIQLFASRGYAVLVFQRPPSFAETLPDRRWRSWDELETENFRGWRDRRHVLSALLGGIREAEALGAVDSTRIGITGLSDGSTTTWFALINAPIFAAAAVSTCCTDPHTGAILGGPAWKTALEGYGFPKPGENRPDFWRAISPARNAGSIRVPVLMQLSDDEYIRGLEAFSALRDHLRPVDMYVFPGERHVKWQPAHRLAIYERNLDWFDFWLKGKENGGPERAEQYRHWRALRLEAATGAADRDAEAPRSDQLRIQASASTNANMRR